MFPCILLHFCRTINLESGVNTRTSINTVRLSTKSKHSTHYLLCDWFSPHGSKLLLSDGMARCDANYQKGENTKHKIISHMTTWQPTAEQRVLNPGITTPRRWAKRVQTQTNEWKKKFFVWTFIYHKSCKIKNTFNSFPLMRQYLKLYCNRITYGKHSNIVNIERFVLTVYSRRIVDSVLELSFKTRWVQTAVAVRYCTNIQGNNNNLLNFISH